MIVRGKTISGPQSVLSFTSPAAKVTQIRCERSFVRIHCVFRRMFHFGIFLSNVHFGGINAESFQLRSTTLNIHISVADDQKLESPLGPYYAENSTFLCGRRAEFETVLRRSKPRVTFVSLPSTCLSALPSCAKEGSKSTCVGDQRLPVRSTQPRVT